MKTDKPFVLDNFLPYQLAVVAERISHDFAKCYRERFGLSRAEWRVLAHLSQDSLVSVREIADRASLDKSKVSRAVTRLEAVGYIIKQISEADRRLVVLSLSQAGQQVVDELAPLALEFDGEMNSVMGPECETFRRILRRMMMGDR